MSPLVIVVVILLILALGGSWRYPDARNMGGILIGVLVVVLILMLLGVL